MSLKQKRSCYSCADRLGIIFLLENYYLPGDLEAQIARRPQDGHRDHCERNIAIFSTDIDSRDFKMHKPDQVIKSVMSQLVGPWRQSQVSRG